ncbi:S8 family serine peptidase [Saccharothrix sp. S26]|uniref:S8 family peptidase n=1 Tax=Saccharothrix sp. S26 TaxID=2907215 RepID=UPI001F25A4BF|nr:S8 family serine peptidase [Saccharothrix sp. S26]MCE6998449.1 S8 family serine peptidase [Saccharothrix sp. S26]
MPTNRLRRFRSPVMEVHGALIRPGELLVEDAFEDDLRPLLERHGGRPYRPGPPGRDWRQDPSAPDYGDVNARLREARLAHRLWVGFADEVPVDLVRRQRLRGLHFHHVYVGAVGVQDFYQGGPDGWAAALTGARPTLGPAVGQPTPSVAVLDTGVPADWETTHPDLGPFLRLNPDALPIDPLDGDDAGSLLDVQGGHGLFIAGLIARVAPEVSTQVFRVLETTGETDDAELCLALTSKELTAPVINLSLGGFTDDDLPSLMLSTALDAVLNDGKVVVAAAGASDQPDRPFYPAAYAYQGPPPGVISVGGCDTTGGSAVAWSKSNKAEVYAPAVELVSTYVSGWAHPNDAAAVFTGWAKWTGTSFAAPLVAAEIARRFTKAQGLDPVREVANTFLGQLPNAGWQPSARLYEVQPPPTAWQCG